MDGPLSQLRGVQHHGGACGKARGGGKGQIRPGGPEPQAPAHPGGGYRWGDPLFHRHGGAGPGSGRRRGGGVPGSGRRRPRYRQIHAASADLRKAVRGTAGALCFRRGKRTAAEAAGTAAGGSAGGAVYSLGDPAFRCGGGRGANPAGYSDCGLHSDHVQ